MDYLRDYLGGILSSNNAKDLLEAITKKLKELDKAESHNLLSRFYNA